MSKSIRYSFIALISVVLFSGCALLKKTPKIPSPAGQWSYTIMSPDGEVGGELTLIGDVDELTGTLTNEVLYSTKTVENITYDGSALAFVFNADQYGDIAVNVVVTGDTFSGVIEVAGFGEMPITGSRVTE